ncbi:MAG: hypothetical protein LBU16_08700 [Treponema sp.]|jgi:hypothetical protein|nr:hypothetical protein [Treponema sp.]
MFKKLKELLIEAIKEFFTEVMLTTTDLDEDYEDGKLMFSAGLLNAAPGHVGSISSPIPVTTPTLQLPTSLHDPVVMSYPVNSANVDAVQAFLFKILSKGGVIPSSCTLRVMEVPSPATANWTDLTGSQTKTDDIRLKYGGNDIFTDPRAITWHGGHLFGVDYDSPLLTILGKTELNGQSGDCTPLIAPYDLSTLLNGDSEARGQAIATLSNKLYALYISVNKDATQFNPSKIIRLDVSGTSLTNGVMSYLGRNGQEICFIKDSNGNIWILIPCIGGMQNVDKTNGKNSSIRILPVTDEWPEEADTLVTGDPTDGLEGDIHDLAAFFRDGSSYVFILLTLYGLDYTALNYSVYMGKADDVVDLLDPTQQNIPTIMDAVRQNKLIKIDDGSINSPTKDEPSGLYHPCIFPIQHPTDPEKDLIVFVRGSEIIISRALAYGSPTAIGDFKENPYVKFTNAGGVNLNSIDDTISARDQLFGEDRKAHKHGGRLSSAADAAAAAKAAKASGESGGEENK